MTEVDSYKQIMVNRFVTLFVTYLNFSRERAVELLNEYTSFHGGVDDMVTFIYFNAVGVNYQFIREFMDKGISNSNIYVKFER